jgi:hypothetical protein
MRLVQAKTRATSAKILKSVQEGWGNGEKISTAKARYL